MTAKKVIPKAKKQPVKKAANKDIEAKTVTSPETVNFDFYRNQNGSFKEK